MRCKLAALAVLAASVLFALPAQASLKLCNRTSYILYAATASVANSGATVHGWTRIAPGDCQTALPEKLTAKSYLVYARSALAHSGPQRAWGGDYPLCVADANFTLTRRDNPPNCTGNVFSASFATVETHGRPDWTMTFDDQPPRPSMEMAQLAGVRRLLKDNGYKLAAIDAKPDKATGAALTDFRKKMKFAERDGNEKLFATLETEAGKRGGAPQGYTVCNDDGGDVMVAVGEAAGGDFVSRGWWRIAGGACGRVITTPLNEKAIWLLAQRPGGATLVSGPDQFCTATDAFEIKGRSNCAARNFAQAGFVSIPTHGKNSGIVHVDANGLVQAGISK